MTREEIEKLPIIIAMMLSESVLVDTKEKIHEKLTEVCNLAIKGLEQEPNCSEIPTGSTTKNDLGVVQDLVSTITEKISEQVTETHEEFIFETIKPYCENVVQMKISKRELEQALLKYYGKNDLGVDCISRKSIKQKLQEHHDFFVNAYGGFSNLPQNDKSRVDEITNCIAMVVNEPPVTPQEPFINKPCVSGEACEHDKNKVLDKIREQIKSHLRGVEITLEILVENDPLRPKMEGAKDTLEECLELIDKAEIEPQESEDKE